MKTITKLQQVKAPAEKKKLRVAAYCQVSTGSDAQFESLDTQKTYFENYINSRSDWELAGIYFYEGITGTKKEKRTALLQLMSDCENHQIDMVITKSLSRFSRNTTDCLELVRRLLTVNVPIFFEKENLNTGSMESELMLAILSSMAEGESTSTSGNTKWAVQKRFQNGTFKISYPPYGYDWDGGEMKVNPTQAEIVKKIFSAFLSGIGINQIAKEFNDRQIPTKKGGRWSHGTIKGILTNEKYIGDALLQKTYTTDFLSKTRIKNNCTVPQYYVEGNHEAIIPKEIFMQVQEELVRRRVVHTSANGRKSSYSSNHCFSQLIFCGECNEMFRRIHWNNRGCKSIVWRCESRLTNTGVACRARTISEELMQDIILKAINEMILDKSGYMKMLQENIAMVIRNDASASTDDIDAKLVDLQKELLQKANNRDDYDSIAEEIFQLRELKAKSETDSVIRDEKLARITELCDFLKTEPGEITVFDESLVRRMLQKITVFEDRFTVEFKSGVSVDIEG